MRLLPGHIMYIKEELVYPNILVERFDYVRDFRICPWSYQAVSRIFDYLR